MPFLQDVLTTALVCFFTKFLHLYLNLLLFLNVSFISLHHLQMQTQLRKLFSSAFPHVTISFVLCLTVQLCMFINSCVKAAEPCMLEKRPGTYTHESETICKSQPLLERNGNVLLWPLSHTILTLDTPSHLMILKSSALVTLSLSYFYGKVYLSPN